MSSLLPFLFNLQHGATAIGGAESGNVPPEQVSKDQARPSSFPLSPAFSQIFREQRDASAFFKKPETPVAIRTQHDGATQDHLTQKDLRNLEDLISPDAVERALSEPQSSRIETFPDVSVPPTPGSKILPDSGSLSSTKLLDASLTTPINTVPERSQIVSLEQPTSPVSVPLTAVTTIERFQAPVAALFQGREGASADGGPIAGQVRQDFGSASDVSRKIQVSPSQILEPRATPQQIPFSKVPEAGAVPQSVSQGLAEKHTSALLNREGESIARAVVTPTKNVLSGQEQVGGAVKQNKTQKAPIPPSPLSYVSAQPPIPPSKYTIPATAIQADGLTGFTDRAPINQPSIKPVLGTPSVSNYVLGSVGEHRTPVPVDLKGESVLLSKGDRTQYVDEASVRGIGLETSGGQGLGMGMNHSSNSQSGFQQSPFSPGEGVALRALEERRPDLPAPALQRLQMDVQISESNRVHIDVGVQNRQVYAGVVMDHSVLRNLAAQFVPQLENQLSQVDLELQEFSAEVREERQQEAETMLHDPRSRGHQETEGPAAGEVSPTQNLLNRYQEQGLHLVA